MLRKCLIIAWISLTPAAALAGENASSNQEFINSSLESAIRENARQAGVSTSWVENRFDEARELRSQGIDPDPYLAKLSEGLAKRVPLERLDAALDRQRKAVQQAHKLAGNLGKRHPETVAAGAQLLASGASAEDVDALYDASRKSPEPSSRFLALAFGAAGLKNAGLDWKSASRFEAELSSRELTADDIGDVNQAVAAAVTDRLIGADDLPRLVKSDLGTAGEARRFVTEIRNRGGRPADGDRDHDKADKRNDREQGKPSVKEGKGKPATSDKDSGSSGKGPGSKSER